MGELVAAGSHGVAGRRLGSPLPHGPSEHRVWDWVGCGRGSLRSFSPSPPPNRTEPFRCYPALQWARSTASGPQASRPLPWLSYSTCAPLPCDWLSPSLTTTSTL